MKHANSIHIIFAALATLCLWSCQQKEELVASSDKITFRASDAEVFVDTKADVVTSLTSFYVTATTGAVSSQTPEWENAVFEGQSVFSSDKFWPDEDPGYHFSASNAQIEMESGHPVINLQDNGKDVVVAYLPSPVYKQVNELVFKHIFARLHNVIVTTDDGLELNDVSVLITPNIAGRFDIVSGYGKDDGTGWSAATPGEPVSIAPVSAGTKENDIFLLPGDYIISASWKTSEGNYIKSHTGEFSVSLSAGKENNIHINLPGGEKGMKISFCVSVEAWTQKDVVAEPITQDNPDEDTFKGLTFEAINAGTITWTNDGTANEYPVTVQYQLNDGDWKEITSTNEGVTINVSAGDIIHWKGDIKDRIYRTSSSFGGTAKFYAYGDIQSLQDYRTTASANCYHNLFAGSKVQLHPQKPLILSASSLSNNCYDSMFADCTSLVEAPSISATTLASYCCQSMFRACVSLKSAPSLPATILADHCYRSMFQGCTSLTTAPALPATTLAAYCYDNMFYGCTSLKSVPSLPATILAEHCYSYMFYDCTSLTSAPSLPATELEAYCYYNMFNGCISLKAAPSILPAESLKIYCYGYMFQNCSSLEVAPALPAASPQEGCYGNMFNGCTKLNDIKANINVFVSAYTGNWVYGVASTGTFYKNPSVKTEFGAKAIPEGWTVKDYPAN